MAAADAKHMLGNFKELCQIWTDLAQANSAEEECLALIELLEKIRIKWLEAHNENQGLKTVVQSLEGDAEYKAQQLRESKAQLIDARAQIASLVSKNQAIEAERAQLERQIELVRDLLKEDVRFMPEANQKNYAFLQNQKPSSKVSRGDSMSTLDDVDIDYDHTGDSMDEEAEVSTLRNGRTWNRRSGMRGRKRRSRSAGKLHPSAPAIQEEDEEQPRKRSKEDTEIRGGFGGQNQNNEAAVVTTTITIPVSGTGGTPSANLAITTRKSLNRSFSEPHLNGPPPPYDTNLTPRPILKSQMNLRTPTSASSLRSWTSSGMLTNRRHLFIGKTVLKMEHCDFCKKRVPFGKSVLRCQDCQYATHPECKDQVPLPCVPRNPGTPKNSRGGKLGDYTPSLPPMIPPLIIHCILELERRGLDTLGIYRIPGTEKDVQDLLSQFLSNRGSPNLKLVEDVHVLTGCIKKFLGQLKDPLIPATSWREFVGIAERKFENGDWTQLLEAIMDLPMPNRDTLAFFIVHLKKVAGHSDYNKMPQENLAKVLGPTVVGYSSEIVGMQEAMEETPKQESVMNALMNLPREYWDEFLTFSDGQPLMGGNGTNTATLRTPESIPPAVGTLPASVGLRQENQVPRTASSLKKGKKQPFFAPPWK